MIFMMELSVVAKLTDLKLRWIPEILEITLKQDLKLNDTNHIFSLKIVSYNFKTWFRYSAPQSQSMLAKKVGARTSGAISV